MACCWYPGAVLQTLRTNGTMLKEQAFLDHARLPRKRKYVDLAMTRTVGLSSRPATRPFRGESRKLTTLTAPEADKIFRGSPAKLPSRPAY